MNLQSESWMDEFVALLDQRKVESLYEEDLVVAHLLEFFGGDVDKVLLWLDMKNPLLGGARPCVVLVCRPGKLLDFVETTTAENAP